MKVVTSVEMKEIDRKTIEDFGIPSETLMQRAGLSVSKRINEAFKPRKVLVLSGPGNNGGDGIVAGRELYKSGWNVLVIILSEKDKLGKDCLNEYKIAKKFGVPMEFRTKINAKDTHSSVIIDAIFGTGLRKPVTGEIANVIGFLNTSGSPIVSVDIPSGVSSDTGQVMGVGVKADITVTFGLPKRGHFLYPGRDLTGVLFIEDIGFPKELINSSSLKCHKIDKEDILIPERPFYSHKGTYGHVLIIAGSKGKTGAALMAGKACLRAGAGLVTLGVPESLMSIIQARVTEEMTLSLPETNSMLSLRALPKILRFLDEKADVLAIGPGIGVTKETEKLMKELLIRCIKPMVIDADGINVLKKELLKNTRAPLILTPHPGEMARLVGVNVSDIEKDRIGIALSFVKDFPNVVLVLKGVPTITASKNKGAFINTTGNPGMAKAGVGDVLTGMLAGLLAQGLCPIHAGITATYLHGIAGDISAEKKGYHSLIASDIIEAIPDAFCKVKGG
ncbi:MAG: NAD(P)H-hydrate dehydratase [Nitrospirae bacterium]|nr:NAD(P)H-hydrate dehydratase [Nitrospirota bacterium]